MAKRDITSNGALHLVRREIRIMYSLNHPYVIKLHNHFEDDRFFYLILELAEGGTLFKHSSKTRGLDEAQVAQFMREVAIGVYYLHHKDPPIIHRDIKPENILLDANNVAKLGDFGWSNFYTEEQRQTLCGTPEYLAPEMISKSGHTTTLDLWNLGILMFEMLAGHAPFRARSGDELYAKILKNKLEFPRNFPLGARDLVQMLLRSDPSERITIEGLLRHPWMMSHAPIRPTVEISEMTEVLPIETDDCTIPNERPTIAFRPGEFTVIGNTDQDRSPTAQRLSVETLKKRIQGLEASIGLKSSLIASLSASAAQATEFLHTSQQTKDLHFYSRNIEGLHKTVTAQRKKSEDLSALINKRNSQADELLGQLKHAKRTTQALYSNRSQMTSEVMSIKRELIVQDFETSLSWAGQALAVVRAGLTSEAEIEEESNYLLGQAVQQGTSQSLQGDVERLKTQLARRKQEVAKAELEQCEQLIEQLSA
jgi:serine/threonine protein kinase